MGDLVKSVLGEEREAILGWALAVAALVLVLLAAREAVRSALDRRREGHVGRLRAERDHLRVRVRELEEKLARSDTRH